jgi:crotonobetainyl-CoA:carnitine CoA-transferase CaiB-like acyl-CoA transferase
VSLLRSADVILQSYRPGALASLGFSAEEIAGINPSIVYASLSAWGRDGPWKGRRGFDSLVQTTTGFNVDEGDAYEESIGSNVSGTKKPRVLPVQALDHASGYLLAYV